MNTPIRDQDSLTMFPNQSPPHLAVQHHLTTSEEADSKKEPNATNDVVGSIEAVRRRRGRPPGSKNKQKPSVSVSKEPEPCMSPYVLEVCGGSDVIGAVTRFCSRRKSGLCVLSGSGAVCDVSFTGARFRGSFNLLSISATILPQSSPISANSGNKFVVSIVGGEGKTFSGAVVGPLIASGTVYMVAVTFNNPLYHRLPMEEEQADHHIIFRRNSVSAPPLIHDDDQSPAAAGGHHHAPPPTSFSLYKLLVNGFSSF